MYVCEYKYKLVLEHHCTLINHTEKKIVKNGSVRRKVLLCNDNSISVGVGKRSEKPIVKKWLLFNFMSKS